MIGTCGKCARIVTVTKVPGGCIAEAHPSGDSEVCSGSGLAPRGILDDVAPARVTHVVEQDDDWGPTREQEEGWDAREAWIAGSALE